MILFTKLSFFKKIFQNPAFKISFGYLLIGLVYIFFSDKLLLLIVQDPETITKIQTFKGFGFIIATTASLLVYLMSTYVIKQNIRLFRKMENNKDEFNARLQQSYNELQKLHAELEKRVEERTSELVTSNKDLRTLSSSLSHDLRTPLSTILNFARILIKKQKEKPDTQTLEYINNILICGKQMNKLIDDMLKYSKIGREAIVLEEVNLNNIFDEVLKMLSCRIQESLALIKIPKNMPFIKSDPALLSQIFSNLINNALIYIKKDTIPEITIDYEIEKDNYITLFFKDNGIGIAPKHFEYIFNIFNRLHTDEEYIGTGIGLAIVKKNTELLKGAVWIESSIINSGTIFCVQLPL